MKYNREIEVTKHACERYVERFGGAKGVTKEEQLRVASRTIREAFSTARYVSDRLPSEREIGGVLFRNDDMGIDLIVRQCKITTVLIPKNRETGDGRRGTEETSIGKSNQFHGPSVSQNSKVTIQKEVRR